MSETQHIGRKIRERREEKGWSLLYMAELCDLCDKALDQLELGDTDPKLSIVLKAARVLGIDLGELNSCMPPV